MNKKYQIIYADPPWSYNGKIISGTKKGNPTDHYNVMDIDSICSLPIQELADDDCILFLWATYPKLREVFRVIDSWGFEYKTIAFQWVKLNKKNGRPFYGLGRWTRGNTECCLLATKGSPKRLSASVFQLIETSIERHSKKPSIVRDKIVELMGDIPRIELFARKPDTLIEDPSWKGWDVWGNEVESDIQLNAHLDE